LRIAD